MIEEDIVMVYRKDHDHPIILARTAFDEFNRFRIKRMRTGDGARCTHVGNFVHRDYAPAMIFEMKDGTVHELWFVNGFDVTDACAKWIKENNLPCWEEWTNTEKVMFKLKFS